MNRCLASWLIYLLPYLSYKQLSFSVLYVSPPLVKVERKWICSNAVRLKSYAAQWFLAAANILMSSGARETAGRQWPFGNQLPWEVVSAPALEAFKRKLDNHLSDLLWFGYLHWSEGWTMALLAPPNSMILWKMQAHFNTYQFKCAQLPFAAYKQGRSKLYRLAITSI